MAEIRKGSGTQSNPELTRIFVEYHRIADIRSLDH
jgi:hypothetical protein